MKSYNVSNAKNICFMYIYYLFIFRIQKIIGSYFHFEKNTWIFKRNDATEDKYFIVNKTKSCSLDTDVKFKEIMFITFGHFLKK